jgi:hypothetical protein
MKKVLLIVLVSFTSILVANAQTLSSTSTFEDLSLPTDSFWNGSDASGSFTSGFVTYYNTFDSQYSSWGGFAYSSKTDTITSGFANMYSSITGGGHNSDTYGLAYWSAYSGPVSLSLDPIATNIPVSGFYITNNTYAYLSMKNGDSYAKKFGGTTGNDSDWFMLTISGYKNGALTDTVNFFLADYRFADNTKDYIIKDWTYVNLTKLGAVDSMNFALTSSDVGTYGMNTPAYFCIDDMSSIYDVSIAKTKRINTLKAYPNPASSYINITGITESMAQINIFNMQGVLVSSFNVGKGSINERINIQNLRSGVYFIQLTTDAEMVQKRFIKE